MFKACDAPADDQTSADHTSTAGQAEQRSTQLVNFTTEIQDKFLVYDATTVLAESFGLSENGT
jgi:hypothetical protein